MAETGERTIAENEIVVIRLGHRLPRDERISTHVALVSRAFGANEIFYCGQHDGSLETSVSRIVENWGGKFGITYEKSPARKLRELKKEGYCVVHLTMYGIPLPEVLSSESWISKRETGNGKLAVVIGAEQVPREIYEIADFNISVTNQPHSEVAALAVFLNEINEGKPLKREYANSERFAGGRIGIEPDERGKNVRRK